MKNMKKDSKLLWVLLSYYFLCISFSAASDDDPELISKGNNFVDDLLGRIGDNLDPLLLEEFKQGFEREVAFIRITGQVSLEEGKLVGLSSVRRKDNVTVMDLDDLVLTSAQLRFDPLQVSFRGEMLFNGKGPQFTLKARISDPRATLSVAAEKGGHATLMSFNVQRLKDTRITITGLGMFGWAANTISNIAMKALELPAAKLASVKMYEYFANETQQLTYPA